MKLKLQGRKVIPRVRGLPFIGSFLEFFSGDILAFILKNYREFGPVFQCEVFGKPIIVMAGIDANNFVINRGKNHLRSKEFWAKFDKELGANRSILSMDGPDHIRLRRGLSHAYSRETAEDCIGDLLAIARNGIANWPRNRRIPVWDLVAPIVTEQLGKVVTDTTPTGYFDDLKHYVDAVEKVFIMNRRPKWIMHLPRLKKARIRVHELCNRAIHSHGSIDRLGKRRDLIDDLLKLHNQDERFLPKSDMLVTAFAPFAAGIDTVASTCAFMLYALLKHPELMKRVKAECDALFAHGDPSPSAVRNLDLTHRVVKETMRIYPVTPGLVRTVTAPFDFAGYRVPAGSAIVIGCTVTHFLPEIFPNPTHFDVDRYTEARNEHLQPGAFSPFGCGTHRCLGSGFGEWQVAFVIATIVRYAELTLDPPDYSLKIVRDPNPKPDSRFRVRVEMRR